MIVGNTAGYFNVMKKNSSNSPNKKIIMNILIRIALTSLGMQLILNIAVSRDLMHG